MADSRSLKKLVRPFARLALRFEPVRRWRLAHQIRHPGATGGYRPTVDLDYGIQTAGYISGDVLYAAGQTEMMGYASPPADVIRRSLALVPDAEQTVLLDLGCGKGRVLAVGSEFGFREIIGVELSDHLAALADANMEIVRRKFPGRCSIRVLVGDAAEYPLPEVPLAIFLANPFGEAGTRQLLARIEVALQSRTEPITVVYCNPVWGALFDASSAFVRAHALEVPFDELETGFRPETRGAVVIWQDRRHATGKPSPEAQRRIVVTAVGWLCELAPELEEQQKS